MTTDCSALSTRWFAPSGIRWNATRSFLVEKDTCPFGPWTTVACCINVWAFSRAEISPGTLPVSPSIKTETSSLATATATSSFGLEVISLTIMVPRINLCWIFTRIKNRKNCLQFVVLIHSQGKKKLLYRITYIFLIFIGTNTISRLVRNLHEGSIFSICVLKNGNIITGGGKDGKILYFDASLNLTGEEAQASQTPR